MTAPFDIFRLESDDNILWLATANTLEGAKSRVQELSADSPGRYVVFNQKRETNTSSKSRTRTGTRRLTETEDELSIQRPVCFKSDQARKTRLERDAIDAMGGSQAVPCRSFPASGRPSLFRGHLDEIKGTRIFPFFGCSAQPCAANS